MRISLKVGDAIYPLAGAAGVSERTHSSAADLRVSAQTVQDTILRVRAAAARVVDRGNLTTTVTFSTTRKFPDVQRASMWMVDHDRLTPRAGVLVMEDVTPLGAVVRRHLQYAVVSPPTRQHIGASVQLNYTVTGGEIIYVAGEPGTAPGGIVLDLGSASILDDSGFYLYY